MSLPVVAIVGRPNVGKSSLLNALVGRRVSIVDPTPGVTRDRIAVPCPLGPGEDARWVELVDTGGMGIEDVDQLTEHVESQIDYAVADAALVVFVVDARQGVVPLDRHVAQRLRRAGKPVLLLANKVDTVDTISEAHEMRSLGFGEPMLISAAHGLGRSELLDAIAERLGQAAGEAPQRSVMRLAIVGKRNAGKSTFINALAGFQRVIVSERPGTTRDSVDVEVQLDGKTFTLIDTAGVRKRKSFAGDIEFYSHQRALGSIKRCDVALLMIDASVKLSQVDKGLAGELAEQFKPVVLVVNKWDLARDSAQVEDYREYLDKHLPELTYCPLSLTTASEGVNVRQTLRIAEELFQQSNTRVTTADLNKAIEDVLANRGPSHRPGTKPPRLYYASQISVGPPTIVCFVNDIRSFDQNYERYLINQLRQRLPFGEVPIRLIFRARQRREFHRSEE